MADRLLLDLNPDEVSVRLWRGDGTSAVVGRSSWSWPLRSGDLEDLRWYLEDYLRVPFGVYEDRGAAIQARLAGWGEQIFDGALGTGAARDVYARAQESGRPVEVVFRSDSPHVLALPWELMTDPVRGIPLALDGGGMSRSLNQVGVPRLVEPPGERLRVLMVISRSSGVGDVGYRMIARPLLKCLGSIRGPVDLTVLRPPTLNALRETLATAAAAGEPFQIMHFDGHGMMIPRPYGVLAPDSRDGGEGVLVFQKEDGSPDYVSGATLAAALRDGQVPVVVLNACQSGAVGKELEAAVATRLLREGLASVVAMAYSVYAAAAAEFMTAFYGALFDGEPVSSAVAAGRRQLFEHGMRPSPKGDVPLADWMIPVHYWRRQVRLPGLTTSHSRRRAPSRRPLDRTIGPASGQRAERSGSADEFVGRDALFYELETALRVQRVAVLHGPAGSGKSELAWAFATWWAATGGVDGPDCVWWHSFESDTATPGLDAVVNEIGVKVFGQGFALLDQAQRTVDVIEMLRHRPSLVVWDNFETVRTMPSQDPGACRLDDAACAALQGFLDAVAAPSGRTAVLITSRTPEDWLRGVRRLPVGGLKPEEAAEYAGIVLAPYRAAQQRRSDRLFGDLMKMLDGHPLSMRIILPLLKGTGPAELLDGLRGMSPLRGLGTGDRGTSLPASITYSFRHLDERTRRLLPAAGLCQSIVDVDLLTGFTASAGVPARFRGADSETWKAALNAAAQVGLLTRVEDTTYRMHPALPAYLAAYWRSTDPARFEAEWEAAMTAMAAAVAGLAGWVMGETSGGDAGFAYHVVELQHATFAKVLGYAIGQQQWEAAASIFNTLGWWWTIVGAGISTELEMWAARIMAATEHHPGVPPTSGTAQTLWLIAASRRAGHWVAMGRLADAEGSFRQIISIVGSQPRSHLQQSLLARTYYHLGLAMYIRGRKKVAMEWHLKSVEIEEEIGDRAGLADSYRQLGQISGDHGHWDEAEGWYRKSAAVAGEIGSQAGMAAAYFQLGMIAYLRVSLDEADEWNYKSLAIYEETGNFLGKFLAYLQLGETSHERGWLDAAEKWYGRSLVISEKLGNQKMVALCCSQLGEIAEKRDALDIADEWYRKSLGISARLRDKPTMASLYDSLGGTALKRGLLDAADKWYHMSLTVAEELGDRSGVAGCCLGLGRIAGERGTLGAADKWYRRSLAISEELGDLPRVADTCLLLGGNAQVMGRLREAEKLFRRSLAVNEQFGNHRMMAWSCMDLAALEDGRGAAKAALRWVIMAISLHGEFPDSSVEYAAPYLAQLASRLGEKVLDEKWREVTGQPVPETVRSYVRVRQDGIFRPTTIGN